MTRPAVLLAALAAGCATYRPATPAATVARAQQPADVPAAAARPDPADVKALEVTLRDLLIKNLPDPFVTSTDGWGRQEEGVVGTKFHRDGLRLRTEQMRGMRNDGTWRKVEIRVPKWAQPAVRYQICAVKRPGANTTEAEAYIKKVVGGAGRTILKRYGFGLPPRG